MALGTADNQATNNAGERVREWSGKRPMSYVLVGSQVGVSQQDLSELHLADLVVALGELLELDLQNLLLKILHEPAEMNRPVRVPTAQINLSL